MAAADRDRTARVVLALTVAAGGYDLATAGRDRPETKLYRGPFVEVDGESSSRTARWGSHGSPIVLVGGFAEASWVWNRVGPLLARRHRVVAIDLPAVRVQRAPRRRTRESGWVALLPCVRPQARDRAAGRSSGTRSARASRVADALWHPREGARDRAARRRTALGEAAGGPRWLSHLLVPPWYTAVYRLATGSDWIVRQALASAYGPHAPRPSDAELERWKRPFRVEGTAGGVPLACSGTGSRWFRLADARAGCTEPRLRGLGREDHVDEVSAGRASRTRRSAARFVLVPLPATSRCSRTRGPSRARDRDAPPPPLGWGPVASRLVSVFPLVTTRALAQPFTYSAENGNGRGAVVSVRLGRAAGARRRDRRSTRRRRPG